MQTSTNVATSHPTLENILKIKGLSGIGDNSQLPLVASSIFLGKSMSLVSGRNDSINDQSCDNTT